MTRLADKDAKTLGNVAAFPCKNKSVELLRIRRERTNTSFEKKILQLLALKCGTCLIFPEKLL